MRGTFLFYVVRNALLIHDCPCGLNCSNQNIYCAQHCMTMTDQDKVHRRLRMRVDFYLVPDSLKVLSILKAP